MNRIYQGRVSSAQLLDAKGHPIDPPPPDWKWESALWEHHALFQDAVNYYIVCLLALAGGYVEETKRILELRSLITTKPASDANPEEQQFYVWETFRRRGATRRGLRDSVKRYLCLGKADATPEECFAAVLADNPYAQTEEGRKLFDRGLKQVLDYCEKRDVQKAAPEFLTRFCKPVCDITFQEDPARIIRDAQRPRLLQTLHAPTTRFDSPALNAFGPQSVALLKAGREIKGEKLKVKLGEFLSDWRARHPESTTDWARLEKRIKDLPADTAAPDYAATSAKGEDRFLLAAMFFFRLLEKSEFTFGLMKLASRPPKPGAILADEQPSAPAIPTAGDPIRTTRGERGYVFRSFTSLGHWGGDTTGEAKWEKFDIAAFEEALKALHQVDNKGEERQKEREQMEVRWEYQRQFDLKKNQPAPRKWKASGTNDEEQRPPLLFGDPRIARLEELLDVELRAEYEMSEGVEVKYGLHPRTIRGFREIQKKWNEALEAEETYSAEKRERLWQILTDFKKENAETIGSPVLFDALVNEPNWIIWRTMAKRPGDAEFANDPLQALTDERELLADVERLKQPIRLTPADPQYSRRQFYFSDVVKLTERGDYRHEPNQRTVIVPLAVLEGAMWTQVRVRLHYSAPRFLREGLRAEAGENLATMPWLQPMMAALGLPEPMPQDFRDCPVALMPDVGSSGERRILLNFPLTLDETSLLKQLGKAKRWDANQFGPNFKNASWLRWPSTPDANAKSPPWWESGESFRCLSVDLGQRDAGAFALLEATPGAAPKPQSRKLGTIPNGETWWATVRATGMIRLPGEDSKVFRDGGTEPQEELSGERGRNLVAGEWQEARDMCTALGFQPDKLLGADERRYSFPELNGQLLYALRRAQARLARLQSWSCVAYDEPDEKKQEAFEKRRQRIKTQIIEAIEARAEEAKKEEKDRGQELQERSAWLVEVESFVEKKSWPLVADRLKREIANERPILQRELERIADRIQPLRGRRWEWVPRPGDEKNHYLRQTDLNTDDRKTLLAGQRGLSMRRIEQLESFRQRCQALNRALRQEPGKPANLGRSKRGIELPDPCPELLERLDALKEQRVNQTAHLILAQALGVRLKPHATPAAEREKHDIHGEYERIPGREPVDFLVIENLKYYEMSQGRARSENARLMKWCRRHLRDKLIQLCEPYGLRVLEEWPADTSKFCSLTGVAGFRAVELTPEDAKEFRWKKHLDRLRDADAGKRKLSREERQESLRVKALFDQLEVLNKDLLGRHERAKQEGQPFRAKWRTLLAPQNGGPIFVPAAGMEETEEARHGKKLRLQKFTAIAARRPAVGQADINAAINLGLRALAAPETSDIHLRIRSERKNERLIVRADNQREKARWKDGRLEFQSRSGDSLDGLATESRPNFYTDIGSVATYDRARIGTDTLFASGRGIWGSIKGNERHTGKNWLRVNALNNNRLEAGGLGRPLTDEEDNLPM